MTETEDVQTRRLKCEIREGKPWLKYCQDCRWPASEGREENARCEFCACEVMTWEPAKTEGGFVVKPAMRSDILRGGLSGHQRDIGIRLCVSPEDIEILNLIYEGRVVETFPYRTVTLVEVQEAACKVEADLPVPEEPSGFPRDHFTG